MSNTLFKLKRSAVKGKAPNTTNIELGELAINTNDGRLFFKTTDSASSSSIVTLREISGGTGITETNGVVSITDTGTSTGEFGSSTQIPILTVNAQGQITAINETAVAGVSALAFDSANATLTISTADGGSFNARIGLSAFSTTDLSEGTNLYYTTARADSDFDARLATKTTDNLTQGSTNLYYATSLFNTDLATKTTDDLTQGSVNLYYDSARTIATARHSLSATGNISYDATTGVISYTDVPYAGFDSDFATKTTNDLTEGGSTNLYFNNARARSAVSALDNGGDGSFSYDSVTGIFSYTGPSASETRAHFSAGTGIGITNGVISTSITQYTDALARSSLSVNDVGGDGSLSYDSVTGIFTYTGPSATEVRSHLSAGGDLAYDSAIGRYSFTQRTDSQVRGLISVNDAGGDGSLSYDNGTGVITYTGPSASEVRAHFSGGTGVSITNGSVAIGQSVGTTDDVTFGKITQDSAVVNKNISLGSVSNTPTTSGSLYWDSDPQKGLSFIPTTTEGSTDVTINIGQETLIYVHNLTGAQIDNGDAVYVSGTAHGSHPQVSLSKSDNAITARVDGVATMDIPNGGHGYITKIGLVRDVNTGGLTAGSSVYLSKDSAGKFTTTEVTIDQGYPFHIGKVIAVDSTQGSILVDPWTENFEYLRIQDRLRVTGTIEGTTLTVDSAIAFTPIDYLASPAYLEGKMWYNQDAKTLALHSADSDFTHYLGEREWVRVRNSSGTTILKGTPVAPTGVHIPGHPIHGHHPTVVPADASNASAYEVLGVTGHDIPNGAHGYVVVRGYLDGINTTGLTQGSRIHLGTTAGAITVTAPEYPNFPMDLGYCLTADSAGANGSIYVNINDHTLETLYVTGNGRFGGSLTIGGNLNVVGSTTSTVTQNLTVTSNLVKLLSGDTLGTSYQSVGGLDDATFKGSYRGDSDLFYFAKILSADSSGDVIQWGISDSDQMLYGSFNGTYGYGAGFDSANGQTSWNLLTDGLTAPLREGISIQFINATGHQVNDAWGAHPTELNLDLGMVGTYNPAGIGGIKYAGVYRDVGTSRWRFFDGLNQNLDSASGQFEIQDSAGSGYSLSDIEFGTAYGSLSGNATSATSATQLATSRNFILSGNITSNSVGFNGTGNVSLNTSIANNVITNAMINSSAAIADTKLATISTAGKVQNSATTATSANTASAIVARDASGNFSAGSITANLTGNVTGQVSDLSNQTSTIRGLFSVDSSGLGYNSSTGQFSLLNPGVDSAATLALFSAANTGTGYGTLSYSNGDFSFAKVTNDNIRSAISAGTGISISSGQISTTITQYTDALARGAIGVNNNGTGFGSLSYNSGTGAITYNKVTTQNIRDQFSVTGDISYDSATGQFLVNETYSTPAELLTAVKTVDGVGSGLDADKLDNQEGSYYRINVYNSAGTLLN